MVRPTLIVPVPLGARLIVPIDVLLIAHIAVLIHVPPIVPASGLVSNIVPISASTSVPVHALLIVSFPVIVRVPLLSCNCPCPIKYLSHCSCLSVCPAPCPTTIASPCPSSCLFKIQYMQKFKRRNSIRGKLGKIYGRFIGFSLVPLVKLTFRLSPV